MVKRSREDSDLYSRETSVSTNISSDPTDSPHNSSNTAKLVHVDTAIDNLSQADIMRCSLPGHKPTLVFSSFDDYEVHYNKAHVNRCVECCKNFPTPLFLNLHQAENHDPLIAIRKDRGEKTYGCFVEGCDKLCSGPQKRKLHLIDKHMFPKDYDFYIVNDGIDRKTTLLRAGRQRRRSSIAHQKIAGREQNFSTQAASGSKVALDKNQTTKMDIELPDSTPNNQQPSPSNDSLPLVANISSTPADVDGLTGAMSALKFVPLSIRFGGRNRGKAGFSKK